MIPPKTIAASLIFSVIPLMVFSLIDMYERLIIIFSETLYELPETLSNLCANNICYGVQGRIIAHNIL